MSKHNRSPKLPARDSLKRHKSSRTNDVGNDVFDDPGTTDVEMQDSSVDRDDSTPSSLDKVLDYFDYDDDARYGREVNEQMEDEFQGKHRYTNLLLTIVGNCGGKLDVKYKDFRAAKTIVDENRRNLRLLGQLKSIERSDY
jgi:hypothetical protein